MDTIFVKQVKEGGPAHGAGLCTGDRIVKVNRESIIGKTYSQVIALIQNSDVSLELCVMPKDEDILQLFSRDITALAYSQDAYLKGNEAYSGHAQNIPEPPPICYPRIESKEASMTQAQAPEPYPASGALGGHSAPGYRVEIPVPPSPPPPLVAPRTQTVVCVCNESVRTVVVPAADPVERGGRAARSGPSHRTEENRYRSAPPDPGRPSPPPGGPQLQRAPPHPSEPTVYSPSSSTGSRPSPVDPETHPTLSPSLRGAFPPASPGASPSATAHCSPSPTSGSPAASPHRNIDWRTYTPYKDYIDAKRLHTHGCRTLQERLDSLRAVSTPGTAYAPQATPPPPAPGAAQRGPALGSQVRRRSTSHDRGGVSAAGGAPPLRSASHERLGGGAAERTWTPRSWTRSISQDALPSSTAAGRPKPRARSTDSLGRAGGVPQGAERLSQAEAEDRVMLQRGEEARASRQGLGLRSLAQPHRTLGGQGSETPGGGFTKGTPDPLLPSRAGSLVLHPASVSRPSRLSVQNATSESLPALSSSAADPLRDHRAVAVGNHLGYAAPLQRFPLRVRADSPWAEGGREERGLGARSSSCSGPSKRPVQRQLQLTGGADGPVPDGSGALEWRGAAPPCPNGRLGGGLEGLDATVVVLRRDKGLGPRPFRHPPCGLAVNDRGGGSPTLAPPLVKAGSAEGGLCPVPAARREMNSGRLGETLQASGSSNLGDSLDSIPFIDEPSSPSVDHDPPLLLASAVISGTPAITTIPPSPTSPTPLMRRQLSHDHDSLRLMLGESDSGSKTERSKSYDEGLDDYGKAGRGRSYLPGLKGLRKTVDRSSEDSGSRRDSSSDVFSDATKEGLLHFKQLSTDKSKRVGGVMRPWKQMYGVLRGHTLCLYKDKKEGQAHANSQVEEEPLPISIKACLIDISYSDTKRKNVLRLTTSDCEYLFQAEGRDDMLAWIRVIQENSNLDEENAVFTSRDLISRKIKEYNTLMSPTGSRTDSSPKPSRQSLSIRQTLLGGKGETKATSPHSPKEPEKKNIHKDDTSPPKDKGTWRKGMGLMRKQFEKKPAPGNTFGVRLDDCPPAHNNKFVPLIVEVCCKLVEERGLEYTGIYRVPGNNAAISNMQEELNHKGLSDIDVQDDKWRDLNVISSLLKSFFRKLPEPLFTNEKYADFIEANRIEDPVERLKVLKRMLHELPDHHYETLKFLSAHLKTVADSSKKNKMEPRNLAIVFGPTLVRTSEDNMTHMVTHMPDQYKIVETLIQQYEWFFTEDGNEDPVTVTYSHNTVESQPLPNIDHLLTNIGRTCTPSQGEVSDSPTSDSAKSKGSWGSSAGKDPCSREHLVSSIFAVANRKRKKSKDKPQHSSSEDDLDSVFSKKELAEPKHNHQGALHKEVRPSPDAKNPAREKRESVGAGSVELMANAKKEHRNSFFHKEKTPSRQTASPSPSPSPKPSGGSPSFSYRTAPPGKSSTSDPPSLLEENTSDQGTLSSGASGSKSRPRKWTSGAGHDLSAAGPGSGWGASAGAEVSSIASDFSTTSSIAYLMGAEPGALSPEVRGGEEADDERSELISEGRPTETDSEGDFPVFTPGPGAAEGRCLLPSQRMIQGHTLSRRRSLRLKTDSDSSVEGGAPGEGRPPPSTPLSRVLEAMKKGRSTGSLSSSSRSESERPPEAAPAAAAAWGLKITERLKFRLRSSADDVLGLGSRRSSNPDARGADKKKTIRRRHTLGGQRDFAELAVIHDWREQGGVDQAAELSAMDRLKPKCSSQDLSIREWISRERCRAGGPEFSLDPPRAPRALPEEDVGSQGRGGPSALAGAAPQTPSPSASPGPQPTAGEQVNGGALQGKSKATLMVDAHPHKLSGAQVVRSRFYQYL
ncbi:LOW QUALITY PROTEIN: rho GTPase-activating protein 21a [Aplochiton taeniatus]